MENLYIKETEHTPEIKFDAQGGVLKFTGKSYPENTFTFYRPIQDWLSDYLNEHTNKDIVVYMDVNYLNSSSTKLFYEIFDQLESAEDTRVSVEWIYDEDDDMTFETGEEFQEDYERLDFNFVIKS